MDSWFICNNPHPSANIKLFCFPYAGGSSTIYHGWHNWLPKNIEVISVELPGRGRRLKEPAITSLPPLIDALTKAILPRVLDTTYAFFGHSMGAIIAYELVRQLRNRHGLEPDHLFVSGRPAPHVTFKDLTISDLPDDEFIAEIRNLNGTPAEVLENAELMAMMLPLLRSDFRLIQSYVYSPDVPLSCSLTAFGATQDYGVPRELLLPWKELTTASFMVHMLPGDHFFIRSSQTALIEIIKFELGLIRSRLRSSSY